MTTAKAHSGESYQQHHAGEHWSGSNPIPTIQKFIEHLDKDKRERDRRIDNENKARREQERAARQEGKPPEERPKEIPKAKAKYRKVTDPTTGREIEVEDMDKESIERAKHQTVRSFPAAQPKGFEFWC